MNIPTNSPLCRLYDLTYEHDESLAARLLVGPSRDEYPPEQTTLCQFFWRIVLRVLWAQLTNLMYVLLGLGAILGLRRLLLMVLQALHAQQLTWLVLTVTSVLVGVVLVLVVGAIALAGGFALKEYAGGRIARSGDALEERARTSWFFHDVKLSWEFLKALKGRFCPIIRFTETD